MGEIRISKKLFYLLYNHHVNGVKDNDAEIKRLLEEKWERMGNRFLYTQSKTAKTEEEREKARREYLDRKGIRDDFRW